MIATGGYIVDGLGGGDVVGERFGSKIADMSPGLQYLWFPSGIIRGALAAMGLQATVHAESSDLPGVVFQIKTVGAKM